MFTWAFTMNNSNAWHDILFELENSHIPPQQENIAAILCHCPYLQQKKYSKMEWNQKNGQFMFQMLYVK